MYCQRGTPSRNSFPCVRHAHERPTMDAMSAEVSVNDIAEHVIEIRLERPERLNALGVATAAALQAALTTAPSRQARVLLLRGSGRAFCAGADLKERRGM